MVVILYDPTGGGGQVVGVALTLAGVACCAVYTVVARRLIPEARETSQVIFAQQAYALALALGLVVVVGLVGGAVVPTTLTLTGLASAIGSGVIYFAGAYWFYLGALRRVPASRAILAFYLVPIVGVVAGALILGERLDAVQWVGVAMILVSVIAIVRQPAEDDVRARVATPVGVDER